MSQIVSIDLVSAAKRSPDIPDGLSDQRLKTAADRYEKFLLLAARYRNADLIPTKEIDMMWHLHMLHPRAYHKDCMNLFGDILDHDGGFGSDPSEANEHLSTLHATRELWKKEFGEDYAPSRTFHSPGRTTTLASLEEQPASCLTNCSTLKLSPVEALKEQSASCMSG